MRAVHQLFDDAPKILDDPIALSLLDEDGRRALAERPVWIDSPAALRLRSRLVVRSRYAEERLEDAVRRGVRQCVILGAGYDSFAYRQPAWARDLTLYEVDHPATQEGKRARLADAGVPIPANLTFAPIDFETTSLVDGLRATSLDFKEPAFFSCLGVLVYLTREAVDAIFQLVAAFPEGSEIVFSFSQSGGGEIAERVAAGGEPWLTHFTYAEIEESLRRLGFSEVNSLGVEETRRLYFQRPRGDGLEAPPKPFMASAIVGAKSARSLHGG